MECIVALYPGDVILPEHILENISRAEMRGSEVLKAQEGHPASKAGGESLIPLRTHEIELEKQVLLDALKVCGNNRSRTAAYLGISRRTLYRRLEEYEIPFK